MKWIYVTISVLIISVLLLIYELNLLDRQYTQLIDTGTTRLRLVQRLTFNSNRRHILLFYIAHSTDSSERTRFEKDRNGLLTENDSIFNALVKLDSVFPNQVVGIEAAGKARKIYNDSTHRYLSRVMKSKNPYVNDASDRELDRVFLNYQNHINALYSNQNNSVLTLRNVFSSSMERKSIWIVLFTISPLLVLALLFIVLIFLLKYDTGKAYF